MQRDRRLTQLELELLRGDLGAESALRQAYRAGAKDAADIAGGWTGDINNARNCAVVSEVCREISKEIRERCK